MNQNKQNLIQSPTRPPPTTTRALPPSTTITQTTTLRPTYEQTTRAFIQSTFSSPQPFRASVPQAFNKQPEPQKTTIKTTVQPKAKFNDNYVVSTYRPSHNFLNHARGSLHGDIKIYNLSYIQFNLINCQFL